MLAVGLRMYLDAFWELSTCRGPMGGPIPWTAIDAYCRRLEIDGDHFATMVCHIRAMDTAMLEREEAKRPKPTEG